MVLVDVFAHINIGYLSRFGNFRLHAGGSSSHACDKKGSISYEEHGKSVALFILLKLLNIVVANQETEGIGSCSHRGF